MTALANTTTLPENRLASLPFLNGHSVKFDSECERARKWLAEQVTGNFSGEVTITFQYRHGSATGARLAVEKTERM